MNIQRTPVAFRTLLAAAVSATIMSMGQTAVAGNESLGQESFVSRDATVSQDALAAVQHKINLSASNQPNPYNRFIVYYRDSAQGVSSQDGTLSRSAERAMFNHLDEVNRQTGLALDYVRSVATGGRLIQVNEKLTAGRAVDVMAALAQSQDVVYVEPDAMMQAQLTPNDSSYNQQWHYFEATGGLNLPGAWDQVNGSGVTVAVIDTGITSHSDLNANVVAGYDFISDATAARDGNGRDSNPADQGDWFAANECGVSYSSNSSWHGSHVAGTVAAVTNNNSGVAGVAYGAKISPVRVLGKCGGSLSDIADAIIWASGGSVSGVPANSNPAQVINMSLGGSGSCGTTYQNAINSAVNRGTVVVVAAGNSNANVSGFRPANCSNVISVAALDRQGNRASYSNYGTGIDITAPGGETATNSNGVLSTLNSGTTTPGGQTYAFYQGTSMAAPHIAGLAALMLDANGSMTPAQIESTMKANARPIPGSCSGGCGVGVADATATINAILGGGGGGGGGGSSELTSGVPVSGLSGASGSQQFFTINVPSGSSKLTVALAGGSGDADLYVRFGSAPTTGSYDCRPYLGGNNENCSFDNPAAGTWHIMLNGYSAYSGASLTGTVTAGGGSQPSFFENTANYTIRDRSTVESPISVSRTGSAPSNLRVAVDIKHTYRGDLRIDLVAPDGSSYRLKNTSSSDSADNVIATYTVNASSETASGTWRLRVYDAYNGDTGYIDAWSLQF